MRKPGPPVGSISTVLKGTECKLPPSPGPHREGWGGFSLQTQTPVLQLLGLDPGAPCPAFARSWGPKGNFPRGGVQAWEAAPQCCAP